MAFDNNQSQNENSASKNQCVTFIPVIHICDQHVQNQTARKENSYRLQNMLQVVYTAV